MYIYVVVQFYPWFKFSFLLFLGMVMYDNNMIMSLKQKKRRFEPRIKLNHNIYKLQRPCQFHNSTRTDGKFSVVARNLVVTVHHSRVPAWNAFIATIGFGSVKSYTNCRTFQEEPPTRLAQLSFKAPWKRTHHCWSTTPNIMDVTCCVWLQTLLHVVACCCAKFENGETFEPTTPNISFVQWLTKRSATMIDSFAELFPFSTPVLTLLTLRVSSQKLCGGVTTIVTKFGRTLRLIKRWRQKRSTVAN